MSISRDGPVPGPVPAPGPYTPPLPDGEITPGLLGIPPTLACEIGRPTSPTGLPGDPGPFTETDTLPGPLTCVAGPLLPPGEKLPGGLGEILPGDPGDPRDPGDPGPR